MVGIAFLPAISCCRVRSGVFGRRFGEIAKDLWMLRRNAEYAGRQSAIDPQCLSRTFTGRRRRPAHHRRVTDAQRDLDRRAERHGRVGPVLRGHGALSLVDSVSGLGRRRIPYGRVGLRRRYDGLAEGARSPARRCDGRVSDRARAAVSKSRTPRYYFDLTKAREFAHEGQTPWTPPVSIVYALDVALQRYHAEGMHGRVRAARALCSRGSGSIRSARLYVRFTTRRALGNRRRGVPPAGTRWPHCWNACAKNTASYCPAVKENSPAKSCASARMGDIAVDDERSSRRFAMRTAVRSVRCRRRSRYCGVSRDLEVVRGLTTAR